MKLKLHSKEGGGRRCLFSKKKKKHLMQTLDKLQLGPWDWMPSGRQDAVGILPNTFFHLFSAAPRLVYNVS